MNNSNDQKSSRRERVIVIVKTHYVNRSDLKEKLGFIDKISGKKTILFISNKVCKNVKANKAGWTSPMTKKALARTRLLCDNQRHSGFPLRWLTAFEGVYVWSLFLNAFAMQLRLVSNQKLTRIQRRANRRLQSKVFRFWEKYENGEKTAAQLLKSISTLNGPSRAE